jgi:predicted nucleic acid-binding protein
MIVIADTTPLNYLVLIRESHLLPQLYGRVLIPQAVCDELRQERTPAPVRAWVAKRPAWLEVRQASVPLDSELEELDRGEREAIALALELRADLLIVDDRDARVAACRRNLVVIGTLRVLEDAAQLDLVDLPRAMQRLQQTTFRASPHLVRALLERDAERRKKLQP